MKNTVEQELAHAISLRVRPAVFKVAAVAATFVILKVVGAIELSWLWLPVCAALPLASEVVAFIVWAIVSGV